MADKPVPNGFGLIIIGSEILDGRRNDAHMPFCRDMLAARHHALRYCWVIEDDPALISDSLRLAFAGPSPFFCCGGIGATPDDYTRECAATATGTELERHPEGEAILLDRFGGDATPGRMRMVDFPRGSVLIPNPVNRIPGFSIHHGHFVPGFPKMAAPMMTWVVDEWYGTGIEQVRYAWRLPGSREADLSHLMETFTERFPGLTFSCLPRFVEGGTELEFMVKGTDALATEGRDWLTTALEEANVSFEPR